MSLYHVKMNVDHPEIENKLDVLADKHKLSLFLYLSVEAYLSTPEGIKMCNALCGDGNKRRRTKAAALKPSSKARDVSQEHQRSEIEVPEKPLQKTLKASVAKSPQPIQEKSEFVSNDDIARQLLKKRS